MKIAIECQRLFRPKKHGMEIVALEILREIQKSNTIHDLHIIVKDDADVCIQSSSHLHLDILDGGPYPVWEQKVLPSFIKNIGAALLHCTANTAPLFSKIPLIVTIHDVIYMEKITFGGSAYQNFGNLYRKLVVPRIARRARRIITVSEFEKKIISHKLQIDPNKIEVIHNGLHERYRPVNDPLLIKQVQEKFKLPSHFILHIGNTSPRKNTKGVLQAYSLYRQNNEFALPLVISGCGKEFINKLIKDLKLPGLKSSVFVLDYLPSEELPVLYSLAKIFLYPSFREGFGMPVAEAMACGTPVITSNTSSLPEVAGDAALLTDPFDIKKMADDLTILHRDEKIQKELIEKGFINARRFTWQAAAAKTLNIYNAMEKDLN